MSETVRKLLADAASTVQDITCHPYFVQSTQAGNAFVRLDRIEYPNRFGGICHWNVVVMLPQDQGQAERYVDDKVPAIKAAVESELVVTQVQPQQLNIPGVGVLLCVFINGHREKE
jgi:hypothetical protein